ncbi:cytochrome P450 [Lentinula raphanica]|uniref:Cytochrome P450 n=1 Tax=Lentinula raphanica TaxID=153919 RepID=A0AA38PKF4_9AGAR|nr:cytochrome P450 [Lentinula raphanica]KAJ3844578.1 cytochrome P450 [Lentinula raphanica]KAJ3971821.1 cytochrome P450 [Lentinula raphanica]
MFSSILIPIAILIVFRVFKALQRRSKLPPGPLGLPVFGNLFQLPTSRPWLAFDNWAKQYGPIVYLNIAGQNTIVLNSHKTAADLLERRATIYSDRPDFIVLSIITGGMHWGFSRLDELWKRQRRGAHETLSSQTAKDYFTYQEIESVIMLSQILADSEGFVDHFSRASTSLSLSIVYGWPPLLDSHHPTITGIDRFNADLLEAAAPGSFWVEFEFFKWMRHLPRWMCTWKRNAEESFVRNTTMFERLASDVQKELDAGNDTPSVVGELLQDTEKPGIIEIAWNAASIYSAGAETTAGQLAWFIQAMIFYPETQRIAQDEIDRVVGPYRMPTFADYEHLPYIRATVKEILRWRGVSPIGLPHRLNQDDFYEGYFIPKDTVCFVNNWSLHRDKELYGDDAEHFNPGRFLDIDGNVDSLIAGSKDEGHFSYGFGKRICVGRHVANNSLFIHIASLLWAFNIAAEVGRDGRLNFPDSLQCKEGLIVRPAPFRCKINARRMDIAAIVAQAKADRGIQPGRTERSI